MWLTDSKSKTILISSIMITLTILLICPVKAFSSYYISTGATALNNYGGSCQQVCDNTETDGATALSCISGPVVVENRTGECVPGAGYAAVCADIASASIKVVAQGARSPAPSYPLEASGGHAVGFIQDNFEIKLNGRASADIVFGFRIEGDFSSPKPAWPSRNGSYRVFLSNLTGNRIIIDQNKPLGTYLDPNYPDGATLPVQEETSFTITRDSRFNLQFSLVADADGRDDAPLRSALTTDLSCGLNVYVQVPDGVEITSDSGVLFTRENACPPTPMLPDTQAPPWRFTIDDASCPDIGPVVIDPVVAVGYEYVATPVRFMSVTLPLDVGDNLYDLYLFDHESNDFVFDRSIAGGVKHFFQSGGVDRFQVRGIEVEEALDPDDPLAFMTEVNFMGAGPAEVTMTPITEEVMLPNLPPEAVCQDLDVLLDENGEAVVAPGQIGGDSYDPDGDPVTLGLSPSSFSCADLGANPVTLTATDDSGAADACTAIVNITGGVEIPYDGIDQDCDGSDLTDADGDGFDAVTAGGTDCNDADASIHPDAAETCGDGIDGNCNGDIDEVCAVPGDLNGDGTIDTADYYIFLPAFGTCDGQAGYNAECDYDGDNCITFVDYQTWYGYFLKQ